ncbi:hypothetical protein [Chitinibacter sp. ZOR0017]|uniref:hypothetical protein n=1 Tax=Chitinibacter sp. ZOR0017 TaxID=1339254 RepID=UPI0012E00126|nr:hypothetical protein [Chitinibacter sp. ZOR0017]
MKKSQLLLAIAAAAAAGSASAASPCTGATAPTPATIAAGTFIQTGFTFNCSKNVKLDYTETSATLLTVSKACSIKGKTIYSGTSDSGSLTGTTTGTC